MPEPSPPPLEVEPSAPAEACVIWLHGLGADGSDFLPIVDQFDLTRLPPTRFVFPHAPQRAVTINLGYVMPAWYDIVALDPTAPEDAAGLYASIATVEDLIDREGARGIPARRIVIAGFSQGGNVALNAALRHPQRLAGAMVLSAYLGLPQRLAQEASAANRTLPLFMAHGEADTVVPPGLAQASRAQLEALGYAVEWHTYPMGHSVCAEELRDIEDWLVRVLAP